MRPANHHLPSLITILIACALGIQQNACPVFATEPADSESIVSTDSPSKGSVTFEADIQPLLTRFGCNAGACHGKSRGQNGFALSLLGFDSEFDHGALVHQARGRRISPPAPASSLLLQKATGSVPHGGGKKIEPNSKAYELLREWIAAGGPRTPSDAPKLLKVRVEPAHSRLASKNDVQLTVTAEYSNGYLRDVTEASAFRSNDSAIAAVDPSGHIQAGPVPGETAIMARYMNNIAVSIVTIPVPENSSGESAESTELPQSKDTDARVAKHPIDQIVQEKLELLGMESSRLAKDSTFHRRAYLRIIGRLPTPDETRRFLADDAADKRGALVDRLLERPEYADFWANKWADLLRPNPYRVGIKAVWNLDAWLRRAFRNNMPYDQFVYELVTAKGSTWQNGATVIYRDRPSTVEIGSSVSQLFLGVRLECAKCHHHPFEVWSQDDFYGFAAFFARVGHHGRISPPISGGEELIFTARRGSLIHGRTGEVVEPKTLTGETFAGLDPDEDPRDSLAKWMLDPSNPYFAQVMANRVWSELMGRGIVEPIDDIRATNPATNQPLLDYLAEEFRRGKYDIKNLIRTIATSKAFSRSTTPTDRNETDVNYFSRYYRQRLRAETLLDGINDVLDTDESFAAMAPGARAVQLWTHRSTSLFLDTFGRPDPNQDPPCERTSDSTTPQVLHMMNSPKFNEKLSADSARPARLALGERTNEQLVDEVYHRVLCRPPTENELHLVLAKLPEVKDGKERRPMIEDLFWALMNTPEFLFLD